MFSIPRRRYLLIFTSVILPLITGLLVFGISTASALPTAELEPNDDIFQMTGPIGPDGANGLLATDTDADYFLVRLRPQRQVDIHFSTAACNGADFEIDTLDGSRIASASTLYDNDSSTQSVTTPGTYGGPSITSKIVVDGYHPAPCSYAVSFTASGGGATDVVDSSPLPSLPSVGTTEPNDFAGQANGPLGPNTLYTGAIETDNDVDWLYAPLIGGTTLTMEMSTGAVRANAELKPSSTTDSVLDLYPYANQSKAGSYNVPYSAIYYIKIAGSLGARYRLQLSPAAAVGNPPPRVTIASRKVKRGRSIRIYVENSTAASLTWTLSRKGRVRTRGTSAIRSGVATIPTRSLHRHKKYRLSFSIPGIGKRSATITVR